MSAYTLSDDERAYLVGPGARMDGYYIGFDRTGNAAVDQILSAIAWAGKCCHSTEGWMDESDWDYGPLREGTSINEMIQAAANDAAQRLAAHDESVRAEERERIARNIVRELGEGRAADLAREGA